MQHMLLSTACAVYNGWHCVMDPAISLLSPQLGYEQRELPGHEVWET
jgi:hypothetical protein